MTTTAHNFEFTNDLPTSSGTTLVVRISAGRNRKRRILAQYAGQLRVPDYFGWNWDAFEECLRDLSWLVGIEHVVIVHRDVPFATSAENQQTYLSILQDRLNETQANAPSLRVIFPTSARQVVQNAIRQRLQ